MVMAHRRRRPIISFRRPRFRDEWLAKPAHSASFMKTPENAVVNPVIEHLRSLIAKSVHQSNALNLVSRIT
jgi:hypothetical protein